MARKSLQDPTFTIIFHGLGKTLFSLRLSGDPISSSHGQTGFGVALNIWVVRALIDWIPVSSRWCAVWLDSFVYISSSRLKRCRLSIVSVYVTTAWGLPRAKDMVYSGVSGLTRGACSTDIMIAAGHCNPYFGCSVRMKLRIRYPISVQPIGMTAATISSRFVPTTDYFLRTPALP